MQIKKINVGALSTAKQLTPEQAAILLGYNIRQQSIQNTLDHAIQVAISTAADLNAKLQQESIEGWNKVLGEHGLERDGNWSADLNDQKDAWIVRADELQEAIHQQEAGALAEAPDTENKDLGGKEA